MHPSTRSSASRVQRAAAPARSYRYGTTTTATMAGPATAFTTTHRHRNKEDDQTVPTIQDMQREHIPDTHEYNNHHRTENNHRDTQEQDRDKTEIQQLLLVSASSSSTTPSPSSSSSTSLLSCIFLPLLIVIGVVSSLMIGSSIISALSNHVRSPNKVLLDAVFVQGTTASTNDHHHHHVQTVHTDTYPSPPPADRSLYKVEFQASPLDPSQFVHPDVYQLIKESHEDSPLIPDIAHFVLGATHSGSASPAPFLLQHWLAIRSAKLIGGINSVYCHIVVNHPSGEWWERAHTLCDQQLIVRDVTSIFGRPVYHAQHKADILRLEALLNYGGIAIDIDTIILNHMRPDNETSTLRFKQDMVLGLTQSSTINWADRFDTCIIIARKSSLFIKEWYTAYKHLHYSKTQSRQEKDSQGHTVTVYPDALTAFSADLAWTISVLRPHYLTQLDTQAWGMIYAAEHTGINALYGKSDLHLDSSLAVHLWQTEAEQRTETRDASSDASVPVLTATRVDPSLVVLFNVSSLSAVCEKSKQSLYGRILQKVLNAGNTNEFPCP